MKLDDPMKTVPLAAYLELKREIDSLKFENSGLRCRIAEIEATDAARLISEIKQVRGELYDLYKKVDKLAWRCK
jgi:hypothetical protein